MPILLEAKKTPKGETYLRATIDGHVSLADAQTMDGLLQPGGPHHMGLVLNLIAQGTDYSPEARMHFATMPHNFTRMGTVVTSPLVRAALNFMTRMGGAGSTYRSFNKEEAALAWLDGAPG